MESNLRQIHNIKPTEKNGISLVLSFAGMQSNTFYAFVVNDFQSLKAFAQHGAANTYIEFHMRFSQFYFRSAIILIHFQIGNLSTLSESQQCKPNSGKNQRVGRKPAAKLRKGKVRQRNGG